MVNKKEKPDLVLLDVVMPEGDEEGVRVLREIIKIEPQTCVMMITALGREAVIQRCKKLGASDYIVKPFDENEVADKVHKCLGEQALAAGK